MLWTVKVDFANVIHHNVYGYNIGQIKKYQPNIMSNLLPSKEQALSQIQAITTRLPDPAAQRLLVMPIQITKPLFFIPFLQ